MTITEVVTPSRRRRPHTQPATAAEKLHKSPQPRHENTSTAPPQVHVPRANQTAPVSTPAPPTTTVPVSQTHPVMPLPVDDHDDPSSSDEELRVIRWVPGATRAFSSHPVIVHRGRRFFQPHWTPPHPSTFLPTYASQVFTVTVGQRVGLFENWYVLSW